MLNLETFGFCVLFKTNPFIHPLNQGPAYDMTRLALPGPLWLSEFQ